MRLLLRQEMKETDWVVFHTSRSLSTPGSSRTREKRSAMERMAASAGAQTDTGSPWWRGRSAPFPHTHTHTDVLLYGCHDNRFTRSGWESVWSRVIRPHGGRKRKIFYMLVLCTKQKRHLWSDNEEAFQQMNYNVLALTFKIEFCNNLAGELCENVILHFFLLFFILKLQNEQQWIGKWKSVFIYESKIKIKMNFENEEAFPLIHLHLIYFTYNKRTIQLWFSCIQIKVFIDKVYEANEAMVSSQTLHLQL